jgi:hypothetical protein
MQNTIPHALIFAIQGAALHYSEIRDTSSIFSWLVVYYKNLRYYTKTCLDGLRATMRRLLHDDDDNCNHVTLKGRMTDELRTGTTVDETVTA